MPILSDSWLLQEIANTSPNSGQPLPIANTEKPKRTVRECFYAHKGRQVDKWSHYFPIYQAHFAKYVDKPVRVLEIGVDHGGSLQLWKEYFGPKARITGIDIDPRCKEYEEPQIDVLIADQTEAGLAGMRFDIVIDDGSHIPAHQVATFENLWWSTAGVYLIEDCHTGYPSIAAPEALRYEYPWVIVLEKPKRVIRGTPSRPLRQDEIDAQHLYSHP